MPIASRKPIAEQVVTQVALPKIQPAAYKGIVYDDKNKPLATLIAYITGAPWTVNYYAQVVGEHNDLREIDPGQPGTLQQYHKTFKLEIRVSSALTSTYDSERGITTVSGSATIYPFMTPNVSDYFVAEAGDNQTAIFRITQVDRKTFNRDSVFTIDYDLVGLVESAREIYDDLESKVIRTFHFSKDRLLEGLSPTLKTEEYAKVMNLKVLYSDVVKYYFKTFFNVEHATLLIPGQTSAYFDPHLVNYLMKLVDTNDAPEIRKMRMIPTDKDKFLSQPQFWNLLFDKDYVGKAYSNNVMGLVNKELFNKNSFVQGLAFSNIRYVVYPDTPDTSTYLGTCHDIKLESLEVLAETLSAKGAIFTELNNRYTVDANTFIIIHDVLLDNAYVLSNNFYEESATQSALEILTKDYMKGNTIDIDMLYAICNTFRQWKRLEQFYYAPILMTLIKEADRAQYT